MIFGFFFTLWILPTILHDVQVAATADVTTVLMKVLLVTSLMPFSIIIPDELLVTFAFLYVITTLILKWDFLFKIVYLSPVTLG